MHRCTLSCNFLFSQCSARAPRRMCVCVRCLDGGMPTEYRSRRYTRNRRADRKAAEEGKHQGGASTHGRRNKTRKLATSRASLSPLARGPSSPRLSPPSLPPLERVTPSGFPLFTFIWIFLAARGPSSSHSSRAPRKLAARALLVSPRSPQSPSLFSLPLLPALLLFLLPSRVPAIQRF